MTMISNGDSLAGPAREGLCLLQGMLLCGECGRRLTVRYKGNGGLYPMYQCLWKHREGLASHACLEVSSTPLDNAITDRLVGAITPVTIELALAALTSLEERDREIGAQWRMRIERARYDVDLAERRYEAVDPGNRLIAATLEQRWNEAMQRLHDLEADLAAFERQAMRAVTTEQKQQILKLAGDFPRLWAASTTTPRDRKRILRLLVRDITVTKGPISLSFATSCVVLNQGPFPPPALPGFIGTVRTPPPPRAARPVPRGRPVDWSRPSHQSGFPVLRRSPCACVPPPIPRWTRWVLFSLSSPAMTAFPASTSGSASTSPFSEPARRSLHVAARMLAESPK